MGSCRSGEHQRGEDAVVALIAAAERGEEVTIRRGNRPVVRLVPIDVPNKPRRKVVGALAGQIVIADDFDELGPEWDEYV